MLEVIGFVTITVGFILLIKSKHRRLSIPLIIIGLCILAWALFIRVYLNILPDRALHYDINATLKYVAHLL